MRAGLVVILIGILFFFKNIGLIDSISWGIMWPVITMLIGISMVLRKECGCGGWGCKWCKWCRGVKSTCECESCNNYEDNHLPRRKV